MTALRDIKQILKDELLPESFRERMSYVAEYATVFNYSGLSAGVRKELHILQDKTRTQFMRGDFKQETPALLFFEKSPNSVFFVAGTYANTFLDLLCVTASGLENKTKAAFTELMLRPSEDAKQIELVYARAASPHTNANDEALENFSQIAVHAYFALYGLAASGLLQMKGELSFKELKKGVAFDARNPPSPHLRREHYRNHKSAGLIKVREALVSSREWH